jgi:hypothetical protein
LAQQGERKVSSEIKDKMIAIQGGASYLQVQHRVLWLREQHPDAQILTDIVQLEPEHGYAVVRATVGIPDGGSATAYGTATAATLSRNKEKYLEWAETRAVGRALAFLGYSTAGAQDLDEDPDDLVDAPMPASPRQQPQRPPMRPQNAPQQPVVAQSVVAPSVDLARKLSAISAERERLKWSRVQLREVVESLNLPVKSTDMTEAQADQLLATLAKLQPVSA